MRALKLLPKTLRRLIAEQDDALVMFEENSPLRKFFFAKAKDIDLAQVNADAIGYILPDDTVSLLQIHTRNNDGETETELVRRSVSSPKVHGDSKVVSLSKKLLGLITSLEEQNGYPLKTVFGKRKNGKIFLIHTEPLALPPESMLRVARDLIGRVSKAKQKKLLQQLPSNLSSIQTQFFKGTENTKAFAKGTPVFPGLYCGSEHVFAKATTTPADVPLMQQAKMILTCGGTLSHAAIIAASEGIPCIVGVKSADISKILKVKAAGSSLSFDAYTGQIFEGEFPIEDKSDEFRKMVGDVLFYAKKWMVGKVLANADTPEAIKKAFEAGASGIGLLRTEHMYKENTSLISEFFKAAFANDSAQRRSTLSKMLELTRSMFEKIFEAAGGRYVCIRLLDAPLNELDFTLMREHNPMMGFRGCRFGILMHDFYAMQVQAIVEAYTNSGEGKVGIMVPLISETGELIILRDYILRLWKACGGKPSVLRFGAMVETPRACIISGELAQFCDFLSYGTNDLTQFTFAFSRDDSNYLRGYQELGALDCNPFVTLDSRGVGRLIHLSVEQAKKMNPKIKIGACGQHAGDEASIRVFRELGFDYVSCTAGRVPSAILSMMS